MPTYIVDPLHFHAEGAVVNWDAAAKRLGIRVDGNHPAGSVIELRWILKADRGLPTEPFIVWARPHTAQAGYQPLTLSRQQLLFSGNSTLLTWSQGQMVSVSLDVQAPAGGSVFGFGGSPFLDDAVALQAIPTGNSTITISAKTITSLVVSAGVTVAAARGMAPGGYANTPGWTQVEVVGLPVSLPQWNGVGKHGAPQGMAGAFTDAATAAIARLKRGAPPFGWGPEIAPGVPAPAWSAPDFNALIKEVNQELLNYLHDIAKNFPPAAQAPQSVTVPLPPPQNSSGQHTNKPGTNTQLFPLPMTYMAASTDTFLNLALGFGSAYPYTPPVVVAVVPVFDYMVTAHWEKGFDGVSGPVDYAAVIPAGGAALAPPPPANINTEILGALRPLFTDQTWRETVRLYWDRPPLAQLFRVASCGAARVSTAPAAPAVALMEKRTSGGFRPIVLGGPLDPPEPLDPEWWRANVMDREIDIPTNPGTRQMKYGAAMQDIYGQWSTWVAVDRTIAQPDLDAVRLANPKLSPVPPGSGAVCATSFEFDFLWDWRIRTPKQISFRAKMFAAATHGSPAPVMPAPAGFDRSLAGGGAALLVTFAGAVPSAPGVTIVPVTADGSNVAATFGPAQGTNRRYRVTMTGLALDFGSTGFIGLALWAQGQENIAPNRLTPWPDLPLVTSTGDPRPPVVPVFHVKLGSIPDAAGSSHVQISWTPQPNAKGYFIYEATEASLLDAWGLPEPGHKATLDARLLVIRNRFKLNPIRRPFTRFNATAMTATGADIPLPKGSQGIHVFVVLGVSAGQVESDWPSGPSPQDSIIAVAAPHITKPAAPMIEVQQFFDSATMAYKARVLVTTRPGPRPAMVELYRVRVDDAAKELDTMGPPVARLSSTSGAWTVATAPDPDYGPFITKVNGVDAPSGSWRRVWYRATAWTKEDDTRGGLPGRSEASNAAWVVLPPPDAPVISALALGAGPAPADVMIQFTSAAPLKRTPLGPHGISVRATVAGAVPPPLLSVDTTLDTLGHVQPATGSGIWIVSTAAGVTTYRVLIRRTAVTDAVNFAVRITDPIGRTGSRLITIAAGAIDPPPDLQNLAFHKVALPLPAHVVLTFTSTSPVVAPMDGPYMLKVTGIPTVFVLFPPPPSFTVALGSIPTKLPVGPPPATYVLRSAAGPPFTYTVVSTANLKGFVVRITGPDGKFVEKTV